MKIRAFAWMIVLGWGMIGCGPRPPAPPAPPSAAPAPSVAPVAAPAPDVPPVAPEALSERDLETVVTDQSPGRPFPGVQLALGKPCAFSSPPNYQHCTDPEDNAQLTDGQYVSGHFWVQKGAVGWQNRGRVEIVMDLGTVQSVSALTIHVAGSGEKAAVSFPDAIFFASDDGVRFQRVGFRIGTDLPVVEDWYSHKYILGGLRISARFIAVSLVANGAFMFADEIEVIGGDAATARPLHGPFVTKDEMGPAIAELRKTARADRQTRRTIQRICRSLADSAAAEASGPARESLGKALLRPDLKPDELETQRRIAFEWNARVAAMTHPGRRLLIWPAALWKDFNPEEFPSAGAAGLTALDVTMGSDEYESTGFMLFNAMAATQAVRVVTSDLVGPDAVLPAGGLTLRWAAPVECGDNQIRPDALPRMDGAALLLPPGENRLVWMTVKTDGQPEGEYRGVITVTSETETNTVALTVRVIGVALPRPIPLATYNWAYLDMPALKADPEAAFRDLAAHYINVAVLHPNDLPVLTFDKQGEIVSVDTAAFDAAIRRYLAVGIRQFLFFQYFGDTGTGISRPLGTGTAVPGGMSMGSPVWKTALRHYVAAYTQRCRELGLGQDEYAFYPVDEPNDRMIEVHGPGIWQAMKEANPKARVFVDANASVKNLARLAPFVDIWCPLLPRDRALDAELIRFYQAEKKAGKSFFIYNCQGMDKTFAPLGHYRRMLWRGWDLGVTGAGFWDYADTGNFAGESSAWTDFDGRRPDFSIVYDAGTAPPGVSRREAQIPSRRWEAWRDGVEDYAYLWSLKRLANRGRAQGRNAQAAAAEAVLTAVTEQVSAAPDDEATYRAAHTSLLKALRDLSR